MADTKISDLTEETTLENADDFVIAASGASKRVTFQTLRTAVLVGSGGGGGGGEWPGWGAPPAFEDELDHDFDDGTLGPWTAVAGTEESISLLETTLTVARYDVDTWLGWLLIQVGHAQLVEFRIDYTLADGESVIAPVYLFIPTGGDNAAVAVRVNNNDASSTSSDYVACMVEQDTTEWVPQGNSSADLSGTEHTRAVMEGIGRVVLRIIRDGLTYRCFYSVDGVIWRFLYARTMASAMDNVWISVLGPSSGLTHAAMVAIPFTKKSGNGFLPW